MPAEFSLGTLSNNPTVSSNFVGTSDTRDTFSFTLGSQGNINLALTDMTTDADVQIFRDINGNGVVDVGDTQVGGSFRGGNFDDSINIANQAAGAYVVQVNRFSGDTNYDLRVSTTPFSSASNILPTETEVGVLTTSRSFSESVGNSDTSDVYHFAVGAAGNFRFTLSGLTGDADIRLIRDLDSDLVVDAGEVIGSSAAGGTFTDTFTSSLTAGDNYFVQVYQFSGNPINYNLTMTPVA